MFKSIKQNVKGILATTTIALSMIGFSNANAGAFLNLPGIQGDVSQPGYEGTIEINSMTSKFDSDNCGKFALSKESDSASAPLIAAALKKIPFRAIKVSYVTMNTSQQIVPYMEFTLSGVQVQSVDFNGSGADNGSIPQEIVSLSAGAISITYYDSITGNSYEESIFCQ